jgi:hypothetical protein
VRDGFFALNKVFLIVFLCFALELENFGKNQDGRDICFYLGNVLQIGILKILRFI